MRKGFTILTGIFFTLLFTTCKQFTKNIDEYLSYWSTEVASIHFTIDNPYISVEAASYVSSKEDVTVTITLRNPQDFTLVMPHSSSANAGKVIRFRGCLLNLSMV